MQFINSISTYIVISLVIIVSIILLFIIIHLILAVTETCKLKQRPRELLCFLYATIIGILSFEIYAISAIFVLLHGIQIVKLNESSIYTIEIMIPICDSIGHILILIVLIGRFQLSFKNTIFGEFKYLMRFMYSYILLLTLLLITSILLLIFTKQSIITKIIEIIWELSIEIVILCILYLFVNKLYIVLKWSLKAVNPLKTDLSLYRNFALSLGPHLSQRRSHEEQATNNTAPKLSVQLSIDNVKTNNNTNPPPNEADTNLINIMTKMTLLIVICVIISALSIMCNVFIEIKQKHFNNRNQLYYLFSTIDIIFTSVMIYLQFNFADFIYLKLCGKLDLIFLKIGLKCVKFVLTKNDIKHNKELNVKNIKNIKSAKSLRKLKTIPENDIPENKNNKNNMFNGQIGTDKNTQMNFNLDKTVEIEIIYDDENENKNDESKTKSKSNINTPSHIIQSKINVQSPKTPLMCIEDMNANSVYKVPAIIMSKHSNHDSL